MKKPKFLSLLQSFDASALRRFRKYLCSPLYNEQQQLVALFDFCKARLAEPWDKQAAWQVLYGQDKPFEDLALRRMLSKLNKLAEDFLAQEFFHASPAALAHWKLEALNRAALTKHFKAVLREAQSLHNRPQVRQPLFHYYKQRLALQEYRHSELLNPRKPLMSALEQADFSLDCYYISQKLKNYCEMLGYAQMQAQKPQIHLPPHMMDYLQNSVFLEDGVVKAYYLAARMLEEPEQEASFVALRQMLDEVYQNFAVAELETLFIHLMNYCIYEKINKGHTQYFMELLSLYRSALQYGILEKRGVFDPFHYKNIITVALHVGEADWVEEFIEEYTERLPEAERENARTYNLAKVYFYRKEYDKVVRQLHAVEYSDLFYALGSRLMLLKTYYELGEDMALESLIDSFRIYLLRNKLISRDVRRQYMKVLRFVRKMFYMSPHDKAAIQKLRQEVIEAPHLADKKWILEKVEELGRGE